MIWILDSFLFLAALVGHLVLMIGSHNWFYGLNISKRAGDLVHIGHALLVLAFPVAIWSIWGWSFLNLWSWQEAPIGQRLILIYMGLCLLVALVWLPGITLYRMFRKDPSRAISVQVLDVAKQLGHRPIGAGHHSFLAYFPGNQLFQLECVERVVELPRLPAALEGLTIAHLSDLHFHGTPGKGYYQKIMEHCAGWNPDLVALTGDISDSQIHYRWVVPILGHLRWKTAGVAILGNHDHRHDVRLIRKRLRRLRFHVLENSWMKLPIRGEEVMVIGHEGPWLPGAPDLRECPEDSFRLCLAHTPDQIHWAQKNKVDLMLAGHVHGGQIRIPPFGSVLVPSRLGRRYDSGLFWKSPTLLHVSRGISGEHPIRYNCRPEITLLKLHRAHGN
ncbi:MAG: metallophosphoesterase [Gemmataceae bacterium]